MEPTARWMAFDHQRYNTVNHPSATGRTGAEWFAWPPAADHVESRPPTDPGTGVPDGSDRPWMLLAVAALAPVVVALLLTPWRDRLAAADNALILVVVIVAVATAGQRWAAAVCAVASALAFDFLLTRPYGSFRINRTSDLVTELLLLVVGLAVGDLAARGRTQRVAAWQGRRHLAVLHNVTGMAASGRDPDDVVREAGQELSRLLGLRSCTFRRAETGLAARVGARWGGADWRGGLGHRRPRTPPSRGGSAGSQQRSDPWTLRAAARSLGRRCPASPLPWRSTWPTRWVRHWRAGPGSVDV